ncbi:hypothetical protein, partial [Escherichia coli]|uniref:hypothetical protein n=1 Tax=Escherichia coli TaxID=562 RepID=UPI001BC84790
SLSFSGILLLCESLLLGGAGDAFPRGGGGGWLGGGCRMPGWGEAPSWVGGGGGGGSWGGGVRKE